ncbi:hypothetical protein GCM10012320_26370 [Sinomonas cellulolyticus]|uniref:Uncharacterized protein n=1 Tax=Sinomonas cellulolyticus TaxID=2801916 RepID=A0ABS1K614_9MICC|nr:MULTISPECIES: hypothetical protein [Sinomonas]MBL0707121.1 hypothetical protein [Sinomonas cellulolyticus]GHG54822.1 hypothetical protein GCM10012320_26370 [Sinomonas sp. KCTC 49339]
MNRPAARDATPTEPFLVTEPGGDGAYGPQAPDLETAEAPEDEPFIPAARWRAGRLTKVLVALCLVLAGGLGGAALQKAVDTRTAVTGRTGQFQVGTQNGTGSGGGGGFGGRNRASQSPSAPPSAGAPAPGAPAAPASAPAP